MSHRDIQPQDFVGKTVKSVNFHAENILRFYFTDGTSIAIETEGDIMVACEECVPPALVPQIDFDVAQMLNINDSAWAEPLAKRYMGGVKCDMKSGPCACGAWHHPDRAFESLEDA